jgi:hypothetical protein
MALGRNDFLAPKSSGERPAQLSVLLSQSVVNWPKYSAADLKNRPLCKNLSKLDQFFNNFRVKIREKSSFFKIHS